MSTPADEPAAEPVTPAAEADAFADLPAEGELSEEAAAGEEPVITSPATPAELAAVQGAAITSAARMGFAEEQALAIRSTVASECNDGEFVMFLEVCARHELDPFAKQIWAAKIGGRVAIIVSRDGLLQIANRNADFRGMRGDVVRENDDLRVTHTAEGVVVDHSYSKPKPADRGEIVGAWACVDREGRAPTYFFADMEEYGKNKSGNSPWGTYKAAMILKCAEAMALRKAYSISGVVGEDEVRVQQESDRKQHLTGGLPYGDDDLADRLSYLVGEANKVAPGSYRDAKVRALLASGREELRDELEAFLADHGVDVPVDGSAVEVTEPAAA